MGVELKLVNAKIGEGSIEMIYATGPDAESAEASMSVRWPIETDPQASLAFHCLQALHLMRDALSPEMRELRHIVDQSPEAIRFGQMMQQP